jgi:hypothetical protein
MKPGNRKDIKRLKEVKAILYEEAKRVSERLNGAPIVIVVGGTTDKQSPATIAGWANIVEGREPRFRDIVGILQACIQLECFIHYMEDDLLQDLKETFKNFDESWWARHDAEEED